MGVLDCCMKYILFIFNFFFVLIGIAVIVIGAVLLPDSGDFSNVLNEIDSGLKAPQITLIIVGALIFIVAFLGCCGAIRRNKCMLMSYGTLLLVIFIIQLAIGIYAAVNFSEEGVFSKVEELFARDDEDSQKVFHAMETTLKCCGYGGPTDYTTSGRPLPESCCPSMDCAQGPYATGCGDALTDWIKDAGTVLAGVAIGLSIVEIVGALFAFIQSRKTESSLY